MIAGQIRTMAGNFIAGADAISALPRLRDLWDDHFAFSVDLLGEACVSDEEARAYQKRYLDLIESLPEEVGHWRPDARLEADPWGRVPRTNVSIKISSLSARTDPIDYQGTLRSLSEALRPILQAAERRGVAINFDMEQHSFKDLTLDLFQQVCEEGGFYASLALQAYLRSGEDDARRIIAWTKRTGRQVTVRLIKGAYWDYEVIHAERTGWPVSVWTDKRQTDAAFERMTDLLLAAAPRRADEGGVRLAVGSHNVRSIAHALALVRKYDLPETSVELQMLYGMAESLKAAAAERGLRLRQYVPIGEMIPGMAYLVRRLLENTSNQSWLRAGFFENVPEDQLLASPQETGAATRAPLGPVGDACSTAPAGASPVPESAASGQPESLAHAKQRHQLSPAIDGLGDGQPFLNEPQRDFSHAAQRDRFAAAVWQAETPEVEPVVTEADVEKAIVRSLAAFPAWRDRDAVDRSSLLLRAAAEMRSRRDDLAGIMIRESGKTWREADADVCEAIDFCEYYARRAVRLFRPERLGRFVGEWNEVAYQSRGVAAVIAPWNFPSAIFTGMTVAALATGNTAIAKPSQQSPGIGKAVCEILWPQAVPRRTSVPARTRFSGRRLPRAMRRSRSSPLPDRNRWAWRYSKRPDERPRGKRS